MDGKGQQMKRQTGGQMGSERHKHFDKEKLGLVPAKRKPMDWK